MTDSLIATSVEMICCRGTCSSSPTKCLVLQPFLWSFFTKNLIRTIEDSKLEVRLKACFVGNNLKPVFVLTLEATAAQLSLKAAT